jgi:site-specific DNA-methyltransferase (adenine-specific)
MTPYFESGGIAIYHGDSREILPGLAPSFDALVTDPPYGFGFAAEPTKWRRLAGNAPEAWDDNRPNYLTEILSMAPAQIVWGGNFFSLPVSRGWLVWVKPDAPPSMSTVELAWTNLDRCAQHVSHSIAATNPERLGHPTQKPLAVMKWTLAQLPPRARRVLDPFMGSGTTLVAAKDMGMEAVGIDREERYCEMAAQRLAQQAFDFGEAA